MGPHLAMQLQACIVEVSALAVILPVRGGESVRVGTLQRDAGLPETTLRLADGRSRCVFRRVIAGLGDEPRDVPAGLLTSGKNDVLEHTAVRLAGDFVLRRLMGVRLALMPENGAKAMWAELMYARHHSVE